MKNRYNLSLYAFYSLYFVYMGISSFNPKYFGEIGMDDAQIGLIMSIPGIIGIFFQPVWGILSDRVKYKRSILIVSMFLGGCFLIMTGFFKSVIPILVGMTCITVMFLPSTPVSSSISLENEAQGGAKFGPIRMSGTIGYQIGALAIGFILATSLKGIFSIMGILVIICGFIAMLMPPIEGHQHGKKKVSYIELLKNKKLVFLLIINFVACTTSMFYMSFFTKHLGDLGVDNSTVGIITFISVFLEIPFLFFSQRLYKKLTMWHWLLIGLALNGFRWIALSQVNSVPLIIISNIPTVSIMACFEFFPALYINDHVRAELKGSAQNLLSLVTFGITKLTGALLGGFLATNFGIQPMFMANGILLLAAFVVFLFPCIKLIKEENLSKQNN